MKKWILTVILVILTISCSKPKTYYGDEVFRNEKNEFYRSSDKKLVTNAEIIMDGFLIKIGKNGEIKKTYDESGIEETYENGKVILSLDKESIPNQYTFYNYDEEYKKQYFKFKHGYDDLIIMLPASEKVTIGYSGNKIESIRFHHGEYESEFKRDSNGNLKMDDSLIVDIRIDNPDELDFESLQSINEIYYLYDLVIDKSFIEKYTEPKELAQDFFKNGSSKTLEGKIMLKSKK